MDKLTVESLQGPPEIGESPRKKVDFVATVTEVGTLHFNSPICKVGQMIPNI